MKFSELKVGDRFTVRAPGCDGKVFRVVKNNPGQGTNTTYDNTGVVWGFCPTHEVTKVDDERERTKETLS